MSRLLGYRLALIFWISIIFYWSIKAEEEEEEEEEEDPDKEQVLKVTRDPPIPDPPNSSDVQSLSEALYLEKATLFDEAFPRDKQALDVCKLSNDEAMKLCLKVERLWKYKGDYYVISGAKVVDECKPYKLKIHHTREPPYLHPSYETVQVRKCPFQPKPIFLLKGNTRVPVFALTWSGDEKTDLHIDFYIMDD